MNNMQNQGWIMIEHLQQHAAELRKTVSADEDIGFNV